MPTLLKSDFAAVEHAVASRVVRIVRTELQFEHAAAARSEVARWCSSLGGLPVGELGLLLDWRLAPLARDPELLREVVQGTNALGRHFARHAVLMTSPVGAMQAKRLQRAHESEPEIFTDEDEAYGFLMAR